MGQVFRAYDTRLRRTVAIKILPPEKMADADRKTRFFQEARAASAVIHPNIVVLLDIASESGMDYLVMEYVSGETLKNRIKTGPCRQERWCATASRSRVPWPPHTTPE
jgi:serine/threonine protein kinase